MRNPRSGKKEPAREASPVKQRDVASIRQPFQADIKQKKEKKEISPKKQGGRKPSAPAIEIPISSTAKKLKPEGKVVQPVTPPKKTTAPKTSPDLRSKPPQKAPLNPKAVQKQDSKVPRYQQDLLLQPSRPNRQQRRAAEAAQKAKSGEPVKVAVIPPNPGQIPPVEPPAQTESSTWLTKLEKLIRDVNYQPMDLKALAKKLSVSEDNLSRLKDFLAAEELHGKIMQVRNSLYVLPARLGISVGHLQMNEKGFGFFVPLDPKEPDFYVSAQDTSTALHGDFCLARLKNPGRGSRDENRLRGEIVKVLRRKRTQLVGTLRKTPMFHFVVPDDSRIGRDIYVPEPKMADALGSKVVVELKDWVDPNKPPEGVVTEVLGAPGAPGVDLLSIVRKYELPTDFPENVQQAAADISAAISPEELARREDFRSIFTFTIDPDDAKDFDDALSYQKHANGDLEVYVHIADVSHFVQLGSPLDREAKSRGNSVYLVDRVIPMLPEKLSNGICSLQPNVDRLVKTAVIRLDSKGKVKQFRFAEGVIHSQKRFTYKEAFALIQKPAKAGLSQHLHTLHNMAQIIRKQRRVEGSLDLDFPEVKVRVNDLGIPTSLERVENDFSHQLIEEYMLLANDVVALELKNRNKPGVYRVHESPDPSKLEDFRATVQAMGFTAGDLTHRAEIQKLLTRVSGKPGEAVVKIGLLRSLKRAMYTPKPLGHYGLAKSNYTHFTSPIRRYADLLVHRILFRAPYSADDLAQVCVHISNTERTASEAEQESVKLKKLEYFDREARASQRTSFTAMILEIRPTWVVVELPEFVIQGRIRISSLDGDLFDFNAQRQELKGQRTGAILSSGITLTVEVESVDLARRQVNFKVKRASILKLTRS